MAVQDGEKKRVHDLAREAREDDTMDCEVSAWVMVAIRIDEVTSGYVKTQNSWSKLSVKSGQNCNFPTW